MPLWPTFGVLLTLGCGGDGIQLAEVYGTVTLDGKPLEGANIQFRLDASSDGAGDRPSVAVTDDDGEYVLQYSGDRSGVRPGKYKVSISTFVASYLDGEQQIVPGKPEVLPEVYNVKSTLTADVPEGGGEFDFDLKSHAGAVVQPDAPRGTK